MAQTFALIEISTWKVYLGLILTSLFTGFGSAIGNYLANKSLIKRIERDELSNKDIRNNFLSNMSWFIKLGKFFNKNKNEKK